MMFKRLGFVVLGLCTIATFGCPSPQDNDTGSGDEGGSNGDGGSGAGGKGMGGKGAGGTKAEGGSPGSGGSGDGGSMAAGGTKGDGGSASGGSAMGGMGMGGAGDGGSMGGSGMGGSMGGSGMGGSMGASFATVYTGVIKPGCGCHTGANSPGGLSMKDVMTAYMNLVGKDSMLCPTMKRVMPNDPTKSVLSLVLKGKGTACAKIPDQMPKGKPALPAAQQMMVDAWIMGGAAM